MLRGLLALMLLTIAVVEFLVVASVGCWAAGRTTGLLSVAATGTWLILGCGVAILIWAGAYAISPGPTKYLTV